MRQKSKTRLRTKLLSIIVSVALLLSGIIPAIMSAPLSAEASEQITTQAYQTSPANDIQDGTILHCFDWRYTDIIAELPNIAAAGFTSVQTSPAQVGVSSGQWYWLYQPLGFYAGTNDLGTVDELKALCAEADKYGIKVIVDVVANHLAGNHSNIQWDLKDGQYWHTYGKVTDWSDRYQVTHGEIGMPDLNSEHSYVAQVVSNYINELKSYGVDGIRWDAAKHIGLPSEGCNFWPTVTSQGLYHYGEILVGPDDRTTGNEGLMKEYTNYMSVTDSTYGKALREAFASGTVPTGFGNWSARGISNDKLVYWGESHDTWSNNQDWGYSNGMSQNIIDRAYAVAASRNEVTALYFSRPASAYKEDIKAGQKGSTHFTSAEVAAVNHFHNAMNGQPDYYTTGNNCAVVSRTTGAVVVAGSGSNFYVTVPNGGSTTTPGTYYDAITGEKWTVTSTTMSGKIGPSGIVVLYNESYDFDDIPDDDTDSNIFYKNTNNWNKVYAYYWSNDNTQMTSWPGVEMTNLGGGVYGVEIPENADYIIFSNGEGTQTDDITLAGLYKLYDNGGWSDYGDVSDDTDNDTNDVISNCVYYKNTNNWSKVYAYYWSDENTQMTTWPGVEMTSLGDGVYGIVIPEEADYIIFSNGSGSQTSDITLQGMDKIYNNGNWSNY